MSLGNIVAEINFWFDLKKVSFYYRLQEWDKASNCGWLRLKSVRYLYYFKRNKQTDKRFYARFYDSLFTISIFRFGSIVNNYFRLINTYRYQTFIV